MTRSSVRKVQIFVTILYDPELTSDEYFANASLQTIADEMDEGSFIGQTSVESIEDVPPEKVEAELLALGNDGCFFDYGA